MKTRLFFLAVGVCAALDTALAEGPTIPQRPPPDAFQKLTEDWPFALATPAAPVAEVVKSWVEGFYVSGIDKIYASGKEKISVAIKPNTTEAAFWLVGDQPNDQGISIGGVEWSEKLEDVRVTLKKGSEFATIKYDEKVNRTAAAQANANQPPRQGMPNFPGVKPPMIRPNGAAVPRPANLPQPMPQAAPTALPGPSNTNSNTNAAPVNPVNPALNRNQRVRVINSTPQ